MAAFNERACGSASTAGAGMCDVGAADWRKVNPERAGSAISAANPFHGYETDAARSATRAASVFLFLGDRDLPERKVLARLGDVLYWLGCILAAIVVVWGAVFFFRGDQDGDPYLFSVVAVAAFAIWVIGRALRYILSGK